MKTKRLIYAGLAATLFSSSLINVPAQVSAASQVASSVDSSTSSTSETPAVESSSSQKQSRTSVMLQKPGVQTVNSRDATDAVGQPDNINEPSKDGWSFILTILRKGFSRQPEAEQYIALQDVKKAKISGMSILVGLLNGLGKNLDVQRWHWDATKAKWIDDGVQTKASTGMSIIMGSLGFLDVQDYGLNQTSGNLKEGSYYYQFHFSDWGDYYSDLAKVVIVPTPLPAKTINADTDNGDGTPKIVYSDVDYVANAIIDPVKSTDIVNWAPTSANDKVNLTPTTGRKTTIMAGTGHVDEGSKKYIPDDYYVKKVNQNPNQDGIPAQYTVSAGSATPAVKNLLVGGLPAFNGAADGGGSWHVGGLDELATASGATGAWSYQWVVNDSVGNPISLKNDDGQGVKNVSGSITNLADLNASAALSFDKDSTFMKEAAKATAANKSYQFQLKLNTTLSATKADDNKVAIVSNKAELQAMPVTGKLSLDSVPSFHFNTVDAEDLYEGTAATGTNITATADKLKVTDTRVKPGWKLSAKLTRMQSRTNDQLTGDTITMSGLPKNVVLDSTNNETDIISSDDITATDKSYDASITGKLGLTPNPQLKLTDDEAFSSNVTWTLTSTSPDASSLK